jgi:beta-glucanase (GH16 family)
VKPPERMAPEHALTRMGRRSILAAQNGRRSRGRPRAQATVTLLARVGALAAAFLLAAPAVAAANTGDGFRTETTTLRPSSDAFVNARHPKRNYGSSRTLGVDGRPRVHSHLRFRPRIGNATLKSARLGLYVRRGGSHRFAVARTSNHWREGRITWRNRPSARRPFRHGRARGGRWVWVDVSMLVRSGRPTSLRLATAGRRRLLFASRETRFAPRLRLTYEVQDFDWASAAWDDSHKGERLDLSGYRKTFEDNFDSLSTVTDGRSRSGTWYAPARPDTSLAHFLSPLETPVTFSIDEPGKLTITMQKVGTSWYSGHIQTVNNVGDGFAQRYGYFEAKMAFQKAVSWPAFWLYTPKPYEGPAQSRAEIDVIEAYGDADYDGFHMAVHRHSLDGGVHKGNYSGLSSSKNTAIWGWNDMFDGSFHRYGCLVTPNWIIIYLDGKEVSRFPTYPEAKRPLFMRITLAMQDEFVAKASSPTRLRVDYVRAYALP